MTVNLSQTVNTSKLEHMDLSINLNMIVVAITTKLFE